MALLNRTTFTAAYEVDFVCHMTDMQSLIECAKNPQSYGNAVHIKIFLYQMQLLFIKQLIMIPKYSTSPKNFEKPTNESVLGSQYVGESTFAAVQSGLTDCNNSNLLHTF